MPLDIDLSCALRRTTITGSPAELVTIREFFQILCPGNDPDGLCNQLSAEEKTIVSRYVFAIGKPLPQREDLLRSVKSPSNRKTTFESIEGLFSWQVFNGTLSKVLELAGETESQLQDISGLTIDA